MEPCKEFMEKAIEAAKRSSEKGEYAIGAVIVKNNEIISTGEVRRVRDEDPTAHAEIVAIRDACRKLKSRSLNNCVIYSTQECCPMCASAIIWAKMDGVVFGAFSSDVKGKETSNFSWRQIELSCEEVIEKSSPKLEVIGGFMRDKCVDLINLSQ